MSACHKNKNKQTKKTNISMDQEVAFYSLCISWEGRGCGRRPGWDRMADTLCAAPRRGPRRLALRENWGNFASACRVSPGKPGYADVTHSSPSVRGLMQQTSVLCFMQSLAGSRHLSRGDDPRPLG